jgi:hypothetical protein
MNRDWPILLSRGLDNNSHSDGEARRGFPSVAGRFPPAAQCGLRLLRLPEHPMRARLTVYWTE